MLKMSRICLPPLSCKLHNDLLFPSRGFQVKIAEKRKHWQSRKAQTGPCMLLATKYTNQHNEIRNQLLPAIAAPTSPTWPSALNLLSKIKPASLLFFRRLPLTQSEVTNVRISENGQLGPVWISPEKKKCF